MWLASRINCCNFCEKFPIYIISFQAFVGTGFNLILNYDTGTNFNPAHRQSDFDREPGKVSGDLKFDYIFWNSFQHLYLVRANTSSHEILNKEIEHVEKKIRNFVVQIGMMESSSSVPLPTIQNLLKTHPLLNNPLCAVSDTMEWYDNVCRNIAGFNSYPDTIITRTEGTDESFVSAF